MNNKNTLGRVFAVGCGIKKIFAKRVEF